MFLLMVLAWGNAIVTPSGLPVDLTCWTPPGSTLSWSEQNLGQTELYSSREGATPHSFSQALMGDPLALSY